jgi:hypothetical protein
MQFQASMPTNRANIIGLVACNSLFAENSTALLGDGSRCAFVRDDKMTIYLGNNALVVPGDQLFFRPGTITNSMRNSFSVRGGTVVDWPEAAATPKATPLPSPSLRHIRKRVQHPQNRVSICTQRSKLSNYEQC